MITYYCVVGKSPVRGWVVVCGGIEGCGRDANGYWRAIYTCPILAMDKMLLWKKNWKDMEYKIVEISESELHD